MAEATPQTDTMEALAKQVTGLKESVGAASEKLGKATEDLAKKSEELSRTREELTKTHEEVAELRKSMEASKGNLTGTVQAEASPYSFVEKFREREGYAENAVACLNKGSGKMEAFFVHPKKFY